VERRVEQFQRSGRPTCRRGWKEGERLWFCRQNARGQNHGVERYPYTFFRRRDVLLNVWSPWIYWECSKHDTYICLLLGLH
jgi:hypothetical protein